MEEDTLTLLNPFTFFPDGILKYNSLSLKKAVPNDSSVLNLPKKIMYQQYIFFFTPENVKNNCFVLDTKRKLFMNSVIEEPGFEGRHDFSLSYWKDNIFVLFGGKYKNQRGHEETPAFTVQLLEVNTKERPISISLKPFNNEKRGSKSHPIQIYRNNMYVFEGFGSVNPKSFEVWKLDLYANQWSLCKIEGEAPKPRRNFATALFKNKIYIFGGFLNDFFSTEPTSPAGDVFTFDPNNMQWKKVFSDDFPQLDYKGSTAEIFGEKIYIQNDEMNEFAIFDPENNRLEYSQGLPPNFGWRMLSFENRSTLFRFVGGRATPYIEFQAFEIPTVENKRSAVELPETQLVQIGKNILSEALHMDLLWKNKPFADVTFVVENEEIQAHRIILLKCKYFQDMFNKAEVIEDKINVTDISPTNFQAILGYIYFGKITLTEQMSLELIILASKYCLLDLQVECENYLSNNLGAKNFLKIIKINESVNSAKIKERILEYIVFNIEKLQEEIDIRDIPHQVLVQAMIKMRQNRGTYQIPPPSFK